MSWWMMKNHFVEIWIQHQTMMDHPHHKDLLSLQALDQASSWTFLPGLVVESHYVDDGAYGGDGGGEEVDHDELVEEVAVAVGHPFHSNMSFRKVDG